MTHWRKAPGPASIAAALAVISLGCAAERRAPSISTGDAAADRAPGVDPDVPKEHAPVSEVGGGAGQGAVDAAVDAPTSPADGASAADAGGEGRPDADAGSGGDASPSADTATARDASPETRDATAPYDPCPAAGTPCAVMPLGDSITEGAGSSGGGYRPPLFHLALAAKR